MIHLDTSLLVDVLREAGRAERSRATQFLESLGSEELCISVHVAGELAAGIEQAARPASERLRVRRLIDGLHVAYPDERFPPVYGRLLAWLLARGQRIATMDLLIATSALVDDAPLATRNAKDFGRVPGLRVLGY